MRIPSAGAMPFRSRIQTYGPRGDRGLVLTRPNPKPAYDQSGCAEKSFNYFFYAQQFRYSCRFLVFLEDQLSGHSA